MRVTLHIKDAVPMGKFRPAAGRAQCCVSTQKGEGRPWAFGGLGEPCESKHGGALAPGTHFPRERSASVEASRCRKRKTKTWPDSSLAGVQQSPGSSGPGAELARFAPAWQFGRHSPKIRRLVWGGSSAGRASRSQCEGRGFDPLPLHHFSLSICGCCPRSSVDRATAS